MAFRLKGLKKPDQGIALMRSEDSKDELLNTLDGLEGYYFDGSYHLLPVAEAQKLLDAAEVLARDDETVRSCKMCEASCFAALWMLDDVKPGYALFVEGSSGGSSGLLLPDEAVGTHATVFQAHMRWTEENWDADDWSDKAGAEIAHVLKAINSATAPDSKPVRAVKSELPRKPGR